MGALIPARRSAARTIWVTACSCERVKRSEYGSENLGCMQRWPTLTHIKQNRVANLLRQWKQFLTSTFSAYADLTFVPVDIGEFQLSDLAGTQRKPGQKQKHGSISQFENVAGAGVDYPVDIFCDEEPGN